MRRPSPFFLHGYLVEWWRHYGEGHDLRVHVLHRDGRLLAALPVYVERHLGMRRLRFVGGMQSALGDMLLAQDASDRDAAILIDRVRDGDQDFADLSGLPGKSRLSEGLGAGSLGLIERVEAPVLDLSAGWEETYRAKTSSKKRNLHRRRRRQLAELGRVEMTVARTVPELEGALEDAFRLHRLRWEGRPDGSDFASERGERFQRAAIRALVPLDVPRIVTLKLAGRAIAFHYFFMLEGSMYVHRLAFDPALGRHSPGLVNTLDALEAAAEDGAGFVEYLGGAERYKVELSDRFDPLYQGLGLTTSMRGRAVVAARTGAIRARKRLKRSEALRRAYFEGLAPLRRAGGRLGELAGRGRRRSP